MSAADAMAHAAAPVFAAMAVLTAAHAAPPLLCGGDGWVLGGMAPMYALMSAFHTGPWLRRLGQPDPRPRPSRSR